VNVLVDVVSVLTMEPDDALDALETVFLVAACTMTVERLETVEVTCFFMRAAISK
jgi:hypothetical protein